MQQNESSLDDNEKFHSQVQSHVTNSFKILARFAITKERNSHDINSYSAIYWYCLLQYLLDFNIKYVIVCLNWEKIFIKRLSVYKT